MFIHTVIQAAGEWRALEGATAAGNEAVADGMSLEAIRVKEEPESSSDERVCVKQEAEWSEVAVCVKQEAPCPHTPQHAAGDGEFRYEIPLDPQCLLLPAAESHSHDSLRPAPPPHRRPAKEVPSAGHETVPPQKVNTDTGQHPATNTHEYVCDTCSKTYKWRRYLIQHIRVTHSRAASYRCAVCGREFSQKGNLKRHALVHTGDKPYSCDTCPRKFAELSNLKVHQRIHTGVKPYSCQICNKEFGHLSHFNSHKRVHTGEKRYSCDICNKKFTRLSYFNIHKRIHTGEKPYTCERCKKTFSQNRYLKKHQCTHENN